MKKMETRSLTDSVNAVSGYAKFLDKFPGFANFDIEHWVDGKLMFFQTLIEYELTFSPKILKPLWPEARNEYSKMLSRRMRKSMRPSSPSRSQRP
jgi:hypothetical protein